MNIKIDEFKQNIRNKKAAVIGIGVSNTPLIKFLIANGASVTACDKKEREDLGEHYDTLSSIGCEFSLGENYLSDLNGFDYIFRTPGMRYDLIELVEAQKNGAVITSEMELFFELCPCEILAVTGSDGKTTTTTLINLILKDAGYKTWLGGNIGMPLIDKVEEISKDNKVVLELSSFQLHTMKSSPHVAVVTNLSPNHLDYHTSMDEYIEAKKNIFLHQKAGDKLVLNFDNEITRGFEKECIGEIQFFGRVNSPNSGVMIENNEIVIKNEHGKKKIINAADIKIRGNHNVENYMAAIAATADYVDPENVFNIASTFGGVAHRNEFVRELNGIKFYNDSIGTSPTRSAATISSFEQKVILIAGGYDKKIPFDGFGREVVQKVKSVFLIGKTAEKIETAIKAADVNFPIVKCDSLKEAVEISYQSAKEGDVILLSPACASFDMYKNFEVRGNVFREIVNGLR